MKLGAEIKPVTSGTATLKDAMNDVPRDWVSNVMTPFMLLNSKLVLTPIQ